MTSAGGAIALGVTQALSRWVLTLFAALATIARALSVTVLALGVLAWVDGGERTGPVAVAAAGLGWFSSRLLLTVVHAGAIKQSAGWLSGQSTGTALEAMLRALPEGLGWFALMLPVELLASAWSWIGLLATGWAYGRGLGQGHGGAGAAAALALFLTLWVPLAVAWAVWRRAALVATVRHGLPASVGFTRAVGQVVRRPGALVAVLLVGSFVAFAGEGALSVLASALAPSGRGARLLEAQLLGQLALSVLVSCVAAVGELVCVYGFTALDDATPL